MSKIVPCFFLHPIDKLRVELRRYRSSPYIEVDGKWVPQDGDKCPGRFGYHNADITIGYVDAPGLAEVEKTKDVSAVCDHARKFKYEVPHDDPRWPKKCEYCDYVFLEEDSWQLNFDYMYRRSDNGEEITLESTMPPGAMWDAWWMPSKDTVDGRYLIVQTPGGQWAIDSQASNCTRPGEKHQCWIRHGEPPNIHVDKNGDTCSAGAGSILSGNYHGFLQHGNLVEC